MDAKAAIAATFQTSQLIANSYIEDLGDAELLERPAPGCNPLAWQLGHLIASEHDLLESICPGRGVALPEGFADKHSKAALESGDADYCGKQEYVELLERSGEAFLAALQTMTAEDLDQPAPERMRQMFPTVGHICILIATHRLMHAGQWVPLRRALDKPVVI
jgi:hypothetical protein